MRSIICITHHFKHLNMREIITLVKQNKVVV